MSSSAAPISQPASSVNCRSPRSSDHDPPHCRRPLPARPQEPRPLRLDALAPADWLLRHPLLRPVLLDPRQPLHRQRLLLQRGRGMRGGRLHSRESRRARPGLALPHRDGPHRRARLEDRRLCGCCHPSRWHLGPGREQERCDRQLGAFRQPVDHLRPTLHARRPARRSLGLLQVPAQPLPDRPDGRGHDGADLLRLLAAHPPQVLSQARVLLQLHVAAED